MRNKAEEGEQRPAYIHAEGGGSYIQRRGQNGWRERKEGRPSSHAFQEKAAFSPFLPSFLPSSTPEAPSLNNQPDI